MTSQEVIAAMKHGSINPRTQRSPKDLGRFGLGLKTASFSQCTQLTVVSAKGGGRAGAEWNLQTIEDDDDWLVSELDDADIAAQPFIENLGTAGTLVIWRNLDRLFGAEPGKKGDEIENENHALV